MRIGTRGTAWEKRMNNRSLPIGWRPRLGRLGQGLLLGSLATLGAATVVAMPQDTPGPPETPAPAAVDNGAPSEQPIHPGFLPPGGPMGPRMGGRMGPAFGGRSREEYTEYVAAMGQRPATAQAAALEQFLAKYPQSALAPQARRWVAISRQTPSLPVAPQPGPKPLAGTPLLPTATLTAPQSRPPAQKEAARRGIIDLKPQSLTIHADNSSLSQILRDVSSASGMKVEGLARDERIFGSFGPGKPQEVLSELVDGLGYNVLMLGESDRGVPLQLVLSARTSQTPSQGQPPSQPETGDQDDETIVVDDPGNQPEQQMPVRTFAPVPNGNDPQQSGRATQQMLEQLRRMHQQQQGGDQPPDPPQ